MNRTEYMKQLETELRRLPKEERAEALVYYNEYFDDAGPEREAGVMEELGDPKAAAALIIKETAMKRLDEPKKKAGKGFSTVWIVILALCAAPIGLPLLLAFVIVGLALLVSLAAVVLSAGLCGLILAAAGVLSAGASIYFMTVHPLDAVCILGNGMAAFGIGVLLLLITGYLGYAAGRLMGGCARKLLSGGKKDEKNR